MGWFVVVVIVAIGVTFLYFLSHAQPVPPSAVQNKPVERKVAPSSTSSEYLSRNLSYLPENRPARYERAYLHSSRWDELLRLDNDGMPPLRLTMQNDEFWLCEIQTGEAVNVGNGKLRRLGIWSVRVRGDSYYTAKYAVGDVAKLVREPENKFDPNAVAIHVSGKIIGYFNKRMASGLAKALDTGSELEGLVISVYPPKVIAASPAIMKHLRAGQ